jgi:hypothetical protein
MHPESPSKVYLARLGYLAYTLERLVHEITSNFELIDLETGEAVIWY